MAVVVLGLAVPASASAFTEFAVDRTDDTTGPATTACTAAPNDCTLRGALGRADGTTAPDLVSLPAGVFRRDPSLDGMVIVQSVNIEGAGARKTVIEGPNMAGHGATLDFSVQSGQTSSNDSAIRDVTITKGINNGGGGIFSYGTNLSLDRVLVTGNVAPGIDFMVKTPGIGAGIGFNTPGRRLTIDNSTISGNRAEGKTGSRVGAVWRSSRGRPSIRDSTIAGNIATVMAARRRGRACPPRPAGASRSTA